MMLHYWKIAGRLMRRGLTFSLINILGLSIGIAACLLIYLYVDNEMSYDAYHPKRDRIARITTLIHSPESDLVLAPSPGPLAPTLQRDYPEIEATVRINPAKVVIRQGSELVSAKDFCYSEQSIFSVFYFSFIEGSAAGALSAPHSIVLTRSAVKKYFGDKPALGETLRCNGENYRVTAIIADLPSNSDLPISALLTKDYSSATHWMDNFDTYSFVLFRQATDLRRFTQRMSGLNAKYIQAELDREKDVGCVFQFEAEALSDVHFIQGKLVDNPKGNRAFNRVFSALAVFILVIALLNYINLATARAAQRVKEVGVRKTIGARPGQLIRQFLGESSLLVAIAWLAAIGLVELALPLFNRVLSTHLSFSGWPAILFPIVLFPLTVLLAGGYPAFVLSRFRPITALKGDPVHKTKGASLRKILTTVQFVIALAMLAGTIIFYDQMQFVMHKDTGVDRARILCMPVPEDSVSRDGAPSFVQAVRHESGIEGITVGSGLPAEGVVMSTATGFSNGRQKNLLCNYFFIDPQFLPLLHISLAAGRNFSDSLPTDKREGFLVNEAFVAAMGWKSPLGQSLESGVDRKGKVIGVVRNFFFKSLHNAIEPMLMVYRPDPPLAVLVKTSPGKLDRMKQLWKTYIPAQPFDYYFMDENFDAQYKNDRTGILLFNAFTGLAIFISCLGLYGLVSLITLQRTKEIGIRKVLGASLPQLVLLLSKDQIRLIGVASCIALPLAALGANRWLSTYAWHTTMNVWMFILPVGILLLLALAVTGWRILRAAKNNPVESLRVE